MTGTRSRRSAVSGRTLAAVLACAVAFVLGIALGEALHDSPKPGGTQSIIRSLEPLPAPPARARPATVTATGP